LDKMSFRVGRCGTERGVSYESEAPTAAATHPALFFPFRGGGASLGRVTVGACGKVGYRRPESSRVTLCRCGRLPEPIPVNRPGWRLTRGVFE